MGVEGKSFLVAGVGGGLGSAVVSLLCSSGASVVGVARGEQALRQLESVAKEERWSFLPVEGDMRLQKDADRAVAASLDEFHALHGVAVVVGHWIGGSALLHETTDQEWTSGFADNLDPLYRLGRAALPHFLASSSGSLVAVAAASGVRYVASPSYCAAKAGIIDLIGKLAVDYRSSGVRFNAVLPGNMAKGADPRHGPPAGMPVPLRDNIATSPWEVAKMIRFLLSDEARWVTGTAVTVDGGLSGRGVEQPERPA